MTIVANTELDLRAARQLLDDASHRRLSFYAGLVGLVLVALAALGGGMDARAPAAATVEAGLVAR